MAEPPAPRDICAVFVTFNPDEGLSDRVAVARDQVGGCVIVDNNSAGQTVVERAAAVRDGITLIRNDDNLGVATALNRAVDAARAAGFSWILSFDQDTEPLPSIVNLLAQTLAQCPFAERVAAIGSRSAWDVPDKPCRGRSWTERVHVMTAGCLIDLHAVEAVGGFRDDLFIDYVDVELCLRLRSHGYRIISSCVPTILHRVGAPRARRFLWRTVTPSHHSPSRRYYITRNRLVVWREHGRAEPRYVLGDLIWSIKEVLKLVLAEDDRGSKFRAMALGIADAFRGRMGRRDPT